MLDGAKKPGAKILVSGGARCNVTNTVVSERDFWGGRSTVVRQVLRALPVADTIEFFRGIGVHLHEEADGKLFPDSNRARDVLEALLRETARVGARLLADRRVLQIERRDDGFRIVTNRGDVRAKRVVMATGGLSLPKSGSDGAGLAIAMALGHTIVETTPALAPLVLDAADTMHRDLSGVSQDVELAIWTEGALQIRLAGAMLWTHFGVSGPVALNASRHWLRARINGQQASVAVNFRPSRQFDDVDAEWVRLGRIALDGQVDLAHLSHDNRRRLTRALVEWPLPVAGTRGYGFAEATAGGVPLTEIDPATMESRVCEGLFLVGEMLDVDGRIGGFNFQWAWSSGFVAGRALARD